MKITAIEATENKQVCADFEYSKLRKKKSMTFVLNLSFFFVAFRQKFVHEK